MKVNIRSDKLATVVGPNMLTTRSMIDVQWQETGNIDYVRSLWQSSGRKYPFLKIHELSLQHSVVCNTWLAQSVIVFLYVRVLVFLDSSVFLLFIRFTTWCSCQCTVYLALPRWLWLVYCLNCIVHCIILEIKWWWWWWWWWISRI